MLDGGRQNGQPVRLYQLRALAKLKRSLHNARPIKKFNEGEISEVIESLKKQINDLMYFADLTEIEREVIIQRYAGERLRTIADKNNRTPQCILQIENRVLKKLKEIMQDKELEPYHAIIDALPYIRIANALTSEGEEEEE